MKTYNLIKLTKGDYEVDHIDIVLENVSEKEAREYLINIEEKLKEFNQILNGYRNFAFKLKTQKEKLEWLNNMLNFSNLTKETIKHLKIYCINFENYNIYLFNSKIQSQINSLQGKYLIILSS